MQNTALPPFILMPSEIMMDSRLTLRHIKVLMAICSWRKSNTNLARMSRKMISERTGYSLTRVSDTTTSLVKLGWLKKSGNLGKKQWSEYEIKELNFKKTPVPKTGTTPVPKTGTSIDTKVIDTKVIDTVKNYNKKISYSEKVKDFKPSLSTTNVFKNIYPNLKKSDYLEIIKQFKDQALNRAKPFKDLNAGFRNYIRQGYTKPVKQVENASFRDIGDTVRAQLKNNKRADLPEQILINEK